MPDILIRGMETPGSCAACDFYNVISGRCTRTGTKINFSELTTRSVDCPILELPPHGDLIDLHAMLSESENGKYVWAYDLTDLPEFTKDLPVVVPAERREGEDAPD